MELQRRAHATARAPVSDVLGSERAYNRGDNAAGDSLIGRRA